MGGARLVESRPAALAWTNRHGRTEEVAEFIAGAYAKTIPVLPYAWGTVIDFRDRKKLAVRHVPIRRTKDVSIDRVFHK